MRRIGHIIALLILALGLTACSGLFDQATEEVLEADIAELFIAQAGVEVRPSCRMLRSSRTGACQMTASAREIAELVRHLELQIVRTDADYASIQVWEAEGGCRQYPRFSQTSPASVYRSEARPGGLETGQGLAFEYLLLYHIAETGELCAQASYMIE